jgi:hypothetical protein
MPNKKPSILSPSKHDNSKVVEPASRLSRHHLPPNTFLSSEHYISSVTSRADQFMVCASSEGTSHASTVDVDSESLITKSKLRDMESVRRSPSRREQQATRKSQAEAWDSAEASTIALSVRNCEVTVAADICAVKVMYNIIMDASHSYLQSKNRRLTC